jgi:HK97 family phage prohead protease
MKLRVYPKGAKPTRSKSAPTNAKKDAGRMVLFKNEDGLLVAGQVTKSTTSGHVEVALAVPNDLGLLIITKSKVEVDKDEITFIDMIHEKGDVRQWESNKPVGDVAGKAIKNSDGNTIDVQDVTFNGYGSTFEDFTPADRDGDGVSPDAFAKSISQFRKNPVMLINHHRTVQTMAGSYGKVSTDSKGLLMEGNMSNSSHPDIAHARMLVHEKHLKTLSMGGLFFFGRDEKTINEVDLHEVSLVVIPANPDAEFGTRSLDADDAGKAFATHSKRFGGEVRMKG